MAIASCLLVLALSSSLGTRETMQKHYIFFGSVVALSIAFIGFVKWQDSVWGREHPIQREAQIRSKGHRK